MLLTFFRQRLERKEREGLGKWLDCAPDPIRRRLDEVELSVNKRNQNRGFKRAIQIRFQVRDLLAGKSSFPAPACKISMSTHVFNGVTEVV